MAVLPDRTPARSRVLWLIRQPGLPAAQQARGRCRPRAHDGTIIPTGPNRGTDGRWPPRAATAGSGPSSRRPRPGRGGRRDDRFAALEPIYDAIRNRFDAVASGVARGIGVRRDWGPKYTSSTAVAQSAGHDRLAGVRRRVPEALRPLAPRGCRGSCGCRGCSVERLLGETASTVLAILPPVQGRKESAP